MKTISIWFGHAIEIAESVMSRNSDNDSIVEAVLRHHLVLGIRDAKAISELCKANLSDAAQLHVRRLWENGIRVLYILQEPDTRARTFAEEPWVEEYRTLTSAQRFTNSAWGSRFLNDPRYSQKKQMLEEMKNLVSPEAIDRAGSRRNRALWSVYQMALSVGKEDQYTFLYSYLSQRTHGSPSAIKQLLERGTGGWKYDVADASDQCQAVGGAWLLLVVNALAQRYGWSEVEEEVQGAIQAVSGQNEAPDPRRSKNV